MDSKISQFLLKEFEQQHENIRQITNLTFQKVQFFISLETFVLGGFVSLIGLGFENIINYIFIPAIFLTILGHTIFKTTVHAIIQAIKLDFVNNIIRLYFIRHYGDANDSYYVYFGKRFEFDYVYNILDTDRSANLPKWKNNKDPSTFISIFIGNINAFNITLSIFSVFFGKLAELGLINLIIFILLLALVRLLYIKFFFENVLDKEEEKVIEVWRNHLEQILK